MNITNMSNKEVEQYNQLNLQNYYPMPYVIEQGPHGERGYDLLSRLLKERIIYVHGVVDDSMATAITGSLLFLKSQDNDKPIKMYVNSPGGVITSGMAIVDCMNMINPIVETVGVGQCASMGAIILTAGTPGFRKCLPNCRVMIHQPLGGAEGQATDIMIRAREIERVKKEMIQLMAKATGKAESVIEKDIDRDNFLTSKEALDYGLIDEIIPYVKKKGAKGGKG